MRGFVTWLSLVAVAAATMIAVQTVMAMTVSQDPAITAPISQGAGFLVAGMLSYPFWFQHQPRRRLDFLGHLGVMMFIACTIVAIRIQFHLG